MPKITINLKTKTIKSLQNCVAESNQLVDQVVQKALDDFLDPGYEKDFDELYEEAVKIADKYERVTASLLQRKLKVGYSRAERILISLQRGKL